jgi:hypothetical protein
MINENLTELPEKWGIAVSLNNRDMLIKWRNEGNNSLTVDYGFLHSTKEWSHSINRGYQEINLNQFKKWVLKENVSKDLIGRYLKYIGNSKKDPEYGDYFRIDSMNNNGLFRLKDKTSGYLWHPQDVINGTSEYFELMPKGFDPDNIKKPKRTKKVEDLVYPDVIHLESQEQLDKILKYNKRLYKSFDSNESYMLFGKLGDNSGNGVFFIPYNEPGYTNYEFSDIIFPEEKEESKFIVGKWYKYNDSYIKFKCLENNRFVASDDILHLKYDGSGGSYGKVNGYEYNYKLLTDLSEIQEYLPDGHVDKIINKQETSKQINYKELQDKAWEIYKHVKKGDRYISTRGDEWIATRDAIAIKGRNEDSSYIDCGQGFLWEINDGKELFAKLLPNETKTESKEQTLEEWIKANENFDGTVEQLEHFINNIYTTPRKIYEQLLGKFSKNKAEYLWNLWGKNKTEKWIPKVGDWVVSLEDRGDYRNKGDVFQVLGVDNDCLYYKEHVNGDIETFRPAEPYEILAARVERIDDDLIEKSITTESLIKLSEPYQQKMNGTRFHYTDSTPNQSKKPTIQINTQEETKIQIKFKKSIKI